MLLIIKHMQMMHYYSNFYHFGVVDVTVTVLYLERIKCILTMKKYSLEKKTLYFLTYPNIVHECSHLLGDS